MSQMNSLELSLYNEVAQSNFPRKSIGLLSKHIKEWDVNINHQNEEGKTFLHAFCLSTDPKYLQIFLSTFHPNPFIKDNNKGMPSMYLCSDNQNALYKIMAAYERSYIDEQITNITEQITNIAEQNLLQVMGAFLNLEIKKARI